MPTTVEQIRSYKGPAILSFGFRPFFLAGALWAAIAVLLWLLMLSNQLTLPSAMAPLDWHAHELIYGYVPAIVAGFLLTAVPNWTGRLPVAGTPLLILFLIWLSGRLATLGSAIIGSEISAIVDLSFLAVLIAIIAREIIAGRNTRNLKVLVIVGLLFMGNGAFHLETTYGIGSSYGMRIGIASTILLIMLVGGRIIPSFTRNWLVRQSPGRLPTPFNQLDAGIILVSIFALVCWVLMPLAEVTAIASVIAGGSNLGRLTRWAGERTVAEPLVAILHIAYLFIPIGFLLLSLQIWGPDIIGPTGALHAWTTGAIGLMTLAVMTRASLGHSGKLLTATRPVQLIYILACIAAIARIAAAFDLAGEPMLHVSATAWIAAFAGFVIVYARLLLSKIP